MFADHYIGLSEKWRHGPIYCTELTGKLVCHITGVPETFINVLPMNAEVTIHGVNVTAIDANHCPGAAMLLFQVLYSGSLLQGWHIGIGFNHAMLQLALGHAESRCSSAIRIILLLWILKNTFVLRKLALNLFEWLKCCGSMVA
jgi:hypothetical protein